MRQVQDPYKEYEAGMRSLEGVQGGYKTHTRGTRLVQVPYKGMMQVQDTCKEYEVGMRHLQDI